VCATLAWEKAGKPEQAKLIREEDEEEGEAAVSVVTLNTVAAFAPTPRINPRIEGDGASFRFPCLPDTGATRTVIASDVARAHGLRPLSDDKVKIRAANSNNMACEGTVSITIAYKSFSTCMTALVLSCLSDEILIGWQDLVGLAIIHEGFPAQIKVVGATSDRPVDLADLVERYNDVFQDGEIKPMKGKPMKIHLEGEVRPTRVLTARQIPVHLRESAAEITKITLDSGVIVPVNEPTEWISPAFFVPKPKGGTRLVCDFTGINRFMRRPVNPFPSPQQLLQCVGHKAKVFATFDAVQGYHQILLDHESSLLTTFILLSGRYRYTRAPMGLNASSDEWCARLDATLEGVEGVQKIVDNILIWISGIKDAKTLSSPEEIDTRNLEQWGVEIAGLNNNVATVYSPTRTTQLIRGQSRISTIGGRTPTSPAKGPSDQEKLDKPSLEWELHNILDHQDSALTSAQEKDNAHKLLLDYINVLSQDGEFGQTDLVKHRIHTSEITPVKCQNCPINPAMVEDLQKQINKWIRYGVIKPSMSPWALALVAAKKKNGKTRWCADYRALNEATTKDAYPMPLFEENLAHLSKSRVFSSVDSSGAFNVVDLEEDAKPKTAFATPWGLYQFKRMPFGLCNAPATYSHLMHIVLQHIPANQALSYLHDTLVHSPDLHRHHEYLRNVLEAHRAAGLKLQPSKCKFLPERGQVPVAYNL
jgi:hypothetical protein